MENEEKLVAIVENAEELRCVFLQRMDTPASAKADNLLTPRLAALGGRKVVFDLEKVDYVASAFLRLCLIAARQGKSKLTIINIAPPVRKVLKIAGFESIAEIV